MGDDIDGGDMDSVDTSPDISDTSSDVDNDVPDDIHADIPEDVPDSGGDDLASDASSDIQEDIPEDVPEDTSVDAHEDAPVDIPEDVPEDISTDTAQDSPEDQEEKEPLAEQIEKEDTLRDDIKDNPEFVDESGDIKWPENDGFEGEPQKETLPTGEMIDLYGDEGGRFSSTLGTPYEERSLPFDKASQEYHAYQVEKPLDVLQGETAPAFNQDGGGTQQKMPDSARNLVHDKFLKRI